MRRVCSEDTAPERVVRSLLHSLGFRFRLHRADLPGTPDIVLPKYRIAILVHGCFWHRHENCKRATTPAANQTYWLRKFSRTKARDVQVRGDLGRAGWTPIVIWECETKDLLRLRRKLAVLIQRASGWASASK